MAEDNSDNQVNSVAKDDEKKQEKKKEKGSSNTITKIIKFIARHGVVCTQIGIALLIIIFIIGILQILITMPGLILGKIMEFFNNFFGKIASGFNGDNVSYTVKDEDVLDIAAYIEEMGYDIIGFGFGDVTYKGDDEESNDEESGNTSTKKEIERINVDEGQGVRGYIKEYMVANAATYIPAMWNWSGFFQSLSGSNSDDSQDYSKGMIKFTKDGENVYQGMNLDTSIVTDLHLEIISEEKRLKLSTGGKIYYFDMQDWSAKYGKPLELFLALHLSTMMPDLTYELATNPNFNTKVTIDFQSVRMHYDVKVNTGGYTLEGKTLQDCCVKFLNEEEIYDDYEEPNTNMYNTFYNWANNLKDDVGNSKNALDVVNELKALINEGDRGVNSYWPRITSVGNHWFYNDIIFDGENKSVYGLKETVTKTMDYEADDDTNALYGVGGISLDAKITSSNDGGGVWFQVSEPVAEGPNEAIKALFKGGNSEYPDFTGEYYRYDGTKDTAKKINNAKVLDRGGNEYLFEGKVYKTESRAVKKEPVTFTNANGENSYKNAFAAFAILEKTETEAAEFSYRCLKELLVNLNYFTVEDFQKPVTQVLRWLLSNSNENNKDKVIKSNDQYGISIKTSVGDSIIAPGDGKIIDVVTDDNNITTLTIEFGKLNQDIIDQIKAELGIDEKWYTVDENSVLGMQMVITGIKPYSDIKASGTVTVGQVIGTASGESIQVYMKNTDGSIVDDIEAYIDVKNKYLK